MNSFLTIGGSVRGAGGLSSPVVRPAVPVGGSVGARGVGGIHNPIEILVGDRVGGPGIDTKS